MHHLRCWRTDARFLLTLFGGESRPLGTVIDLVFVDDEPTLSAGGLAMTGVRTKWPATLGARFVLDRIF
ncbi:hypothetical protein C451_05003 [Halococcus thailandensis JCM 13552]|uniref:Uncharacterized protein n=1 Tax=Halococcus thailandensis JCM 13552 TaxID=1227457 RepID=M0NGJ7_9EURY|nr:hypothetical protein C451_05003 [Halococcus thailandensis JCM 13552]